MSNTTMISKTMSAKPADPKTTSGKTHKRSRSGMFKQNKTGVLAQIILTYIQVAILVAYDERSAMRLNHFAVLAPSWEFDANSKDQCGGETQNYEQVRRR
jgi:hypothetical protein